LPTPGRIPLDAGVRDAKLGAMLAPRLLAAAALALLACGCGAIRFQHAWSSFEPGAERGGLEGRWKGEWRSEWNGHSGGLRCLITRRDERHSVAWFYSTYARILFFQHEVLLHASQDPDGTLRFSGEQDLGAAIGGVYRYEGTATQDSFHATFQAENGDHGVFEMRRVDRAALTPEGAPDH
jgi:hypothetical protein